MRIASCNIYSPQADSDDDDISSGDESEEDIDGDDGIMEDLSENETVMRVRVLPLYSLLGTAQVHCWPHGVRV